LLVPATLVYLPEGWICILAARRRHDRRTPILLASSSPSSGPAPPGNASVRLYAQGDYNARTRHRAQHPCSLASARPRVQAEPHRHRSRGSLRAASSRPEARARCQHLFGYGQDHGHFVCRRTAALNPAGPDGPLAPIRHASHAPHAPAQPIAILSLSPPLAQWVELAECPAHDARALSPHRHQPFRLPRFVSVPGAWPIFVPASLAQAYP